MVFTEMPPTVPGLLVWGAERGSYTFMVSEDSANNNEVRASVKPQGATPFDGKRFDLGVFPTVQAAMDACEEWEPVPI